MKAVTLRVKFLWINVHLTKSFAKSEITQADKSVPLKPNKIYLLPTILTASIILAFSYNLDIYKTLVESLLGSITAILSLPVK